MKILSYEECKKELSNIATYGENDITIDSKDIKTLTQDSVFTVEELDLDNGSGNILLSNEDIDIVTKNKNLLVMSISEFSGSYAGIEAIKSAVLDFEENELFLKDADGILVNFKMHTNYLIMELAEAMDIINDKLCDVYIDNEPNVIWGLSCDDNMKEDCVIATVFISYSKQRRGSYVNNVFSRVR
jgi:cell division GTPase FtsZ